MSKTQDEIDLTKGLAQKDLKPCAVCGKGMGHKNDLNFYRVTIESHIINLPAVRRQHGLEQFMGSALLAFHMGPQENMSVLMSKTEPLCICFDCAMSVCLPSVIETHDRKDEEGESDGG